MVHPSMEYHSAIQREYSSDKHKSINESKSIMISKKKKDLTQKAA